MLLRKLRRHELLLSRRARRKQARENALMLMLMLLALALITVCVYTTWYSQIQLRIGAPSGIRFHHRNQPRITTLSAHRVPEITIHTLVTLLMEN